MVTDSRATGTIAAEETQMPSTQRPRRRSDARRAPPRTDDGDLDPAQLRRLLAALNAMRDGNFRKRLPVSGEGLGADLAIAYNEIAERQQHILSELTRVQRVAGREGRHSERLQPGLGEGGWAKCVDAANSLVTDLVRPTGEFARVVAAVSEGDLTQRMDLRLDGQSAARASRCGSPAA